MRLIRFFFGHSSDRPCYVAPDAMRYHERTAYDEVESSVSWAKPVMFTTSTPGRYIGLGDRIERA